MHKNMTNLEIAELLRGVAAAYELQDEVKNKFRIIAYQRAADAIEHLSSEAKDLWDEGKLEDVAGIGTSIAQHLGEIFKEGFSRHFKNIMGNLPPAMFELMKVPGIGPKTAYKLSKNLNIRKADGALESLQASIDEGKVSGIEGFGEQSQEAIRKAIKEAGSKERRMLLPYATQIANEIINWLTKDKGIKRADSLGSLRRKASTIGDIDISVATDSPKEAIERFTEYPKAKRILEKGERTAMILLPGDIHVDLLVQNPDSYGSALQHFTGSKHHNVALREYAQKRNLSLSEYGIKVIKGGNRTLKKFSNEEDFYKYLNMEWIPPELREDTGEIEAARKNILPQLVELNDIKADLQIHSDFDIETSHDLGLSTMEEIILKAQSLGYEYMAFTEHNPSQRGHSNKDIIDILKRKREIVDKINYSHKNIRGIYVFNSLEIDILPDGTLPVSDQGLKLLDFALVSIHSSFRQSKIDATKRVLSALSFPKVKIFAHPTGRKLVQREGVEIDWEKVFEFCVKNNKYLEINADPMRLDLPDFLVKEAVEHGVMLTLGTDAHHTDAMDNMEFGVSVARRGWATKENIINTRSLQEFNKLILK